MTVLDSFSTARAAHSAGETGPTVRALDIAARSVFESQGVPADAESVLAARALDHHWAGLFQYAAIRCGATRAAHLLEQLELELHGLAHEPDSVGPGARLYRALRSRLAENRCQPLTPDASEWWVPPDEALATQVVSLRRALSEPEAEVVELGFTRGFSSQEIAHVTGREKAEVEDLSRLALAQVDEVLGLRQSRAGAREVLLLQLFVLDPGRSRAPRRRARKPLLTTGNVIGDRYEIEALLGAGAFADVYRARDREVTDHVVALKILRGAAADDEAVRLALRELQLIASVFHPSVVQLKDHGWHERHLWFVMPLYSGETLATRLQRAPLNRREAREIFEPLAEALATMHRASVRHQDIKPENVLLAQINPDGEARRILPVLLDLGVAAKDAELVLAGTPAYFAPEVAARFAGVPDPPPVGPKADVFSLALTLRQALEPSPERDVAASAVDAFVAFRAFHAPESPRRRDLRDLSAAFGRWLNFSADARPSAEEFARELSILTRRDEQRARRLALMRWVLPTAFATVALFAGVVLILTGEARLRRIEAEQARLGAQEARARADSIHASLEGEEARRRELEADVARLKREYLKTTLTREELATRLATIEGEFSVLSERERGEVLKIRHQADSLREQREEVSNLSRELEATRTKRDESATELERARAALDAERARREEADSLAMTRGLQLKTAEVLLDETRAHVAELESRLSAARSQRTVERGDQQRSSVATGKP